MEQKLRQELKLKAKQIKNALQKLKGKIKEKYNAEIIAIFGSYAKGTQRDNSDVDVLVKLPKDATLFKLMSLNIFLEEKLGVENIDVVPYNSIRKEIKEDILKEAIFL